MKRPSMGRFLVVAMAAFALVCGVLAAPATSTAQEASPEAIEHNHPAHIHTGTCDEVGEVIHPLTNVASAMDDMASPMAESDSMASPEAGMETEADWVAESTTTITATFDELFAAEHVVNVHESEENIGNYISCGAVTGTPDAEGSLTITLDAMNDSGWDGEAEFVDNGDGTIDVTVRLKAADMGDMAAPEASPEG